MSQAALAMEHITADRIDAAVDWPVLIDALEAGHKGARGQVRDLPLAEGDNVLLNRAAWLPGQGIGLKTVTVFPGNRDLDPPEPSVRGLFVLFDPDRGAPLAVIDGAALTAWKTAGDSALGARHLARRDAETLLMVGAGAMARPLIEAHRAARPSLRRVRIWNRTLARAEALAESLAADGVAAEAADDLATAVSAADVISSATLSDRPLIRGAWLRPGTHLDLVGAFTATMREADDDALRRGRLFVDARETTIGEIGELIDPMARGVISESDVLADLYDLGAGVPGRLGPDDITVFKNGGGAHLDLMTAVAVQRQIAHGKRG